jgi:hypothetical protein
MRSAHRSKAAASAMMRHFSIVALRRRSAGTRRGQALLIKGSGRHVLQEAIASRRPPHAV